VGGPGKKGPRLGRGFGGFGVMGWTDCRIFYFFCCFHACEKKKKKDIAGGDFGFVAGRAQLLGRGFRPVLWNPPPPLCFRRGRRFF